MSFHTLVNMMDVAYCRQEAERYRQMAEAEKNPTVASRFGEFAENFDSLARALDEGHPKEPP